MAALATVSIGPVSFLTFVRRRLLLLPVESPLVYPCTVMLQVDVCTYVYNNHLVNLQQMHHGRDTQCRYQQLNRERTSRFSPMIIEFPQTNVCSMTEI